MLLRSGDLAGFARRLWRRLVTLLSALGRLGGPIGHVQWRERWVDLTDGEREVVAGWASATRFAVVVGDGPPEAVEATVASLAAQLHDGWVLSASAPDVATVGTTAGVADWVVELEPGVVLHEAALATVARAIDADPGLRLVYADFDHLDGSGAPFDPCFLPGWNPDLFDGLGRIGPLVARHRSVAAPQGGAVPALPGGVVAHLPFVLASRPGHLRASDPAPVRRRWPIGDPPPRVSVLIPTRDQGRLLETCLTSLRALTTYPAVEVVLVDHESTEQRARDVIDALADDPDAVVVPFSGPFNFAAMCNRGVEAASGGADQVGQNDGHESPGKGHHRDRVDDADPIAEPRHDGHGGAEAGAGGHAQQEERKGAEESEPQGQAIDRIAQPDAAGDVGGEKQGDRDRGRFL